MQHEPAALPASWSTRTLVSIRRKLLAWFDVHQRSLPWRADRDVYRIWVSEVMLQQTTVAAVSGAFERFLTRFPTLQSLASADEHEVLRQWAGLGYYRRARHLHAAAKMLAASHAGELPDDPAVWAELPGVGDYILGAVLSQAFDRKLPIVEANSLRVLSRLFGYRGDPRQGEGKRWVWAAAEVLLPEVRVGDFNQSLMELGALVCTPATPRCGDCPLRKECVAKREGLQEAIPPKKTAVSVTPVYEVAVIIQDKSKILLGRRPANGRWAGMWEVPHGERLIDEAPVQAASRLAHELTGLQVRVDEPLTTIRHSVTRWSIEMICLAATRRGGRLSSNFHDEIRWVELADLGDYAVSSPQRKLMTLLASQSTQRY